MTRFLFVFPHGVSGAGHAALRTTNADFTAQVRYSRARARQTGRQTDRQTDR